VTALRKPGQEWEGKRLQGGLDYKGARSDPTMAGYRRDGKRRKRANKGKGYEEMERECPKKMERLGETRPIKKRRVLCMIIGDNRGRGKSRPRAAEGEKK